MFIKNHPTGVREVFDDMILSMQDYKPLGRVQATSYLKCLCEMIHAAHNCFCKGLEVAQMFFSKIMTSINPGGDNGGDAVP